MWAVRETFQHFFITIPLSSLPHFENYVLFGNWRIVWNILASILFRTLAFSDLRICLHILRSHSSLSNLPAVGHFMKALGRVFIDKMKYILREKKESGWNENITSSFVTTKMCAEFRQRRCRLTISLCFWWWWWMSVWGEGSSLWILLSSRTVMKERCEKLENFFFVFSPSLFTSPPLKYWKLFH